MGERPERTERNIDPIVRALVLADRIYRDEHSRKMVIAGTFDRILAPVLPWGYPGGSSLYCAVTNVHGPTTLRLSFRESSSDTELFFTETNIELENPLETGELRYDLPPLPLPSDGTYEFQVRTATGTLLSTLKIQVVLAESPPAKEAP